MNEWITIIIIELSLIYSAPKQKQSCTKARYRKMSSHNTVRLVLNSGKSEDLRMKTGNLFHSTGPANVNARFFKFSNWLCDNKFCLRWRSYSSSGLERWTRCNKWGNIRGRWACRPIDSVHQKADFEIYASGYMGASVVHERSGWHDQAVTNFWWAVGGWMRGGHRGPSCNNQV